MLPSSTSIVKAVHPEKAALPIAITVFGIIIFVNEEQSRKALVLIVFKLEPSLNITVVKAIHPEKASSSISVTVFGIFISPGIVISSPKHPRKAPSPIVFNWELALKFTLSK